MALPKAVPILAAILMVVLCESYIAFKNYYKAHEMEQKLEQTNETYLNQVKDLQSQIDSSDGEYQADAVNDVDTEVGYLNGTLQPKNSNFIWYPYNYRLYHCNRRMRYLFRNDEIRTTRWTS